MTKTRVLTILVVNPFNIYNPGLDFWIYSATINV